MVETGRPLAVAMKSVVTAEEEGGERANVDGGELQYRAQCRDPERVGEDEVEAQLLDYYRLASRHPGDTAKKPTS